MSDSNLPEQIQAPKNDFSKSDQELLEKFKERGLPGISSVGQELEKSMESMYMQGYTYQAIALHNRAKKEHVLALADKNKWFEKRNEKLSAMAESIYNRKEIFKSENESFLISFCDSIKQHYSDTVFRFLSTRDPSVLASIDPKLMNLYLKCFETLTNNGKGKGEDSGKGPSQTLVNVQGNLNVGEGRVPETDDLGSILKAIADLDRVKDKK